MRGWVVKWCAATLSTGSPYRPTWRRRTGVYSQARAHHAQPRLSAHVHYDCRSRVASRRTQSPLRVPRPPRATSPRPHLSAFCAAACTVWYCSSLADRSSERPTPTSSAVRASANT